MNSMQKIVFLLGCMFFLTSCGNSKLFPKRYLGNYEGEQEAYHIHAGAKEVTVPAASYTLTLAYDKLWLSTEKQSIEGSYIVSPETKMYYPLTVKLENGITEEWQLWKKGKQLIRKPIAPAPETIFIKK